MKEETQAKLNIILMIFQLFMISSYVGLCEARYLGQSICVERWNTAFAFIVPSPIGNATIGAAATGVRKRLGRRLPESTEEDEP